MLLRIGLPILIVASSAPAVPAQTCDAAPSLRTVGYRAGASAGFGAHVTLMSISGGAALPNSPLYALGGVGLARYKGLERNALTTALRVGLEAPLDALHSSGLCAFATGGTQTGPKNILGTGVDYSDVELGAGLAVGRELRRWEGGSVAVALEGLYRGVFYRYRSGTGKVTDSEGQSAITLTLGVASGRVLLQATLSQPADLNLNPTSFAIGIAIMGSTRHGAAASQLRRLRAPA
jgi:hypothetical protein